MGHAESDLLVKELEFYHVMQPIVDLSNNNVIGYEMLLRTEGSLNPEILFKNAREQNQLYELDFRSIVKALITFSQEKLDRNNIQLFINIFPSTLTNPAFCSSLQKLKSVINIEPSSIVFELNEAEKVTDLISIREAIINLKKQGFLIALDDFGKGESSIQTFLELEPDIAKIDRYFAKDLIHSPKKQKVIKFALQLFGEDATVIMEGFESEADLLKAKELGVPLGQGFFLGKPQPLDYYLQR